MPSHKYLILSIIAILFSGCLTTTIPAKSEYRINTTLKANKTDAQSCTMKSLKVAKAFSSSAIMSNHMMYAIGDSKQYAYAESLWAQNPNSVITSNLLKLLRETELFKSVQVSKSRSRNDFILEINIEDFMQYFNSDSSSSYANIVVSLTLIDIKSNTVYATQTFASKVDVETLNAQGGVKGLSIALNNILAQTNTWISGVCK